MNNEEKKTASGENGSAANTEDIKTVSPETKANGGWWSSLSQTVKIGLIAGVSLLLVAIILLVVLLVGGNGDNGGGGGSGNNGGSSNTNNGGNNNAEKVTYTISVSANGGNAVVAGESVIVYIHKLVDGVIDDEVVAFQPIDAERKVTVELPADGNYAAKIIGIPDGYNLLDYYPILSTNFSIELTSQILPDKGMSGVKYELGSVMHDFTLHSTVIEEDENGDLQLQDKIFTLSEILKEKKAVFINFWGTGCGNCAQEFPVMTQAYEKFKDDIAIIAIDPPNCYSDTAYDVENYQVSNGIPFYMAIDSANLFSGFSGVFPGGEWALPLSVMIDRNGVVSLIELGAILGQREFEEIFAFFTKDDYKQTLVTSKEDIIPKEKPNVEMPSSEEISNVFDKGLLGDIQYIPYRDSASKDEKEYSWPFIIDQVELEGVIYDVIKTSNAFKESSYSQILFNVSLEAGDVLAFDYFASTELGSDILYVVVDGKDIYSISGQNESGWQTCYSYVAEESGEYEIGLIYQKDSSQDVGEDTVFLKDLRIVTEADIDSDTYIFRFAATKPDGFGAYGEYAEIFMGEDGYYHVDSPSGPILLANVMGYTRFSEESTVYYMAIELANAEKITIEEYNLIIEYCTYSSNATINGVTPVTEELREMLVVLSKHYGDPNNANDWLRFCCFYDAYGTDGKQLEDPIKGLATFSAYDVILSDKGATDFPNSFYYDRLIMPRGLMGRFTPTVSGVYLISSFSPDPNKEGYGLETDAWVFVENSLGERELWYTYENVDRLNTTDVNNCYMLLYLEAGKNYYIDIAFYDVYQTGTVNYRVEHLGDADYYRFTQASPGPFTSLENNVGELTETIIRGIPVELGADGFYREKREDGRLGSIIYADFTQYTISFQNNVIYYDGDDPDRVDMISAGAFNFKYSEEDIYVLSYLERVGGDVERCKSELRAELKDAYNKTYVEEDIDGVSYTVTGYAVDEVLAGIYHGRGNDETEAMRAYAEKIVKVGDVITTVSADGTTLVETLVEEGDPRIGCVAVDENLARILQLLMDKYTFEGVENSWLKLCYFEQYFNASTPK